MVCEAVPGARGATRRRKVYVVAVEGRGRHMQARGKTGGPPGVRVFRF